MEDKRINFVDKYRLQFALALAALILVGLGLLFSLSLNQNQLQVELITPPVDRIIVDIAGAVLAPGVYELPASARFNDLLVKAGGLSAEADRDWVNANLNLAQKLIDGQKIYIPEKAPANSAGRQQTEKSKSDKIDINTASAGELDTLSGIGPARAQAIIANRPYASIEEVVTKAKVPQSVFDKIKGNISVF
ncbi:MAG: ComEA family DNA-binding protein [Candidatus Shapirobacteria bacterium]